MRNCMYTRVPSIQIRFCFVFVLFLLVVFCWLFCFVLFWGGRGCFLFFIYQIYFEHVPMVLACAFRLCLKFLPMLLMLDRFQTWRNCPTMLKTSRYFLTNVTRVNMCFLNGIRRVFLYVYGVIYRIQVSGIRFTGTEISLKHPPSNKPICGSKFDDVCICAWLCACACFYVQMMFIWHSTATLPIATTVCYLR